MKSLYKGYIQKTFEGSCEEHGPFILQSMREISENQNKKNVVINVTTNVVTNEDKVLSLLKQDGSMSAGILANKIG